MQRRIFWLTFLTLSVVADIFLPLVWGLVLTLPIIVFAWWLAYKSG
jgi:hypothetical protein